jgi:hypothetical protein
MDSSNPVFYIESRFGIQLKKVSSDEWAGPCPWCGGRDRFHVWERGNYWCRPGPGHCGTEGWVDQLEGKKPPTPEQRMEWRIRELERKQREHEMRLSRLEQMHRCTDHLRYHEELTDEARKYWWGEGIFDQAIDKYLLGYCPQCPTYRESDSYTIPITNHGQLENIRHRLAHPNGGGKYRPHMAGLGISLFNADNLDGAQTIILTEGEKKSIVLDQAGFKSVGITGKRSFKREWLDWFNGVEVVYVALDPDATESAERLAGIFDGRARVVDTPCKIDDMISKYGASSSDIEAYLRLSRPIRARQQ